MSKKRKTSIRIDETLWKRFQIFVIKERGSARKMSEVEEAIKYYMLTKHEEP
jgi:hypothetical protein